MADLNLHQQIYRLIERRDAALKEVDSIDVQLEQVRAALEPQSPRILARPIARIPRTRPYSMGGLSQSEILEALAEREPQTTNMLKKRFPQMTTLGLHVTAMTKAGLLTRRRKCEGGNVFWYARTFNAATVFVGPDFEVEPESGDSGDSEVAAPEPG